MNLNLLHTWTPFLKNPRDTVVKTIPRQNAHPDETFHRPGHLFNPQSFQYSWYLFVSDMHPASALVEVGSNRGTSDNFQTIPSNLYTAECVLMEASTYWNFPGLHGSVLRRVCQTGLDARRRGGARESNLMTRPTPLADGLTPATRTKVSTSIDIFNVWQFVFFLPPSGVRFHPRVTEKRRPFHECPPARALGQTSRMGNPREGNSGVKTQNSGPKSVLRYCVSRNHFA